MGPFAGGGLTTGKPEVGTLWSFRTITPSIILKFSEDRINAVLRRIKPISRIALMDEQSNPFNLLQLKDAMRRHRGVKQNRRYGL